MGNLTNEQLIFLDNLIYLDFEDINTAYVKNGEKLKIGQLLLEIFNDFNKCTDGDPACMTQSEWSNLLKSFMYEYIGDDENGNPIYSEDKLNQSNVDFFNDYVLENYESETDAEGAFRACSFVKRNDIGEVEDVVVIFRGTAGDAIEWEDNVLNANRVWSDELDKSVLYIQDLKAVYGEAANHITVSGHSKGGNRAQYVTILTDQIDRCLSFDGQGFSYEFTEFYEDLINKRSSVITSLSAKYDFVNVLLNPIAGTIEYVDSVPDDNYSLNHCPNRVFNEQGDLNAHVSSPALLSKLIANITTEHIDEIPDEYLNSILQMLSDDLVVPILVNEEDPNLNFGNVSDLLGFVGNIAVKYPEFYASNEYFFIITAGSAMFDDFAHCFEKDMYDDSVESFFKQAELIIKMHKTETNSFIDSPYEVYEAKTEQMMDEYNLQGSSVDIYKQFFDNHYDILSNREFYDNLDTEQIKTLMELNGVMSFSRGEDELLDLKMDRLTDELIDAYKSDGKFTKAMLEFVDNISDFFGGVRDTVGSAVSSVGNTVVKGLSDFRNSVHQTLLAIIDGTFEFSIDISKGIDLLVDLFGVISGIGNSNNPYVLDLETIRNILSAVSLAETMVVDPLVVDLGKTGFELTDVENGTHFDMDANSLAEKTGWIKGDDAFLALDRNGNGIVDNGGELFGDRTLLQNGEYASSGFEALAEFDDDLNGIINAHDAVYNQLLLWQDKNHDGIATADELMTLAEAGIEAINLNYESMDSTDDSTGSTLANISSVVFADGTETVVGEFKFSSDKIDTKDIINFGFSEEILALPNVRAVGGVHSLHYAMAMDETGELKDLVKRFVNSSDVDERLNLVEKILYSLCNAGDIAPNSRGSYVDARHLAVIEVMTDGGFVGLHGPNPSYLAGPELEKAYKELLNAYYNDLTVPSISKYLNFILPKTDSDGNSYSDMSLFNPYVAFNLNKGNISEIQLADLGRAILSKDIDAFLTFKTFFSTGNYSYGGLIEKSCGGMQGTDGNDNLFATIVNNTHII